MVHHGHSQIHHESHLYASKHTVKANHIDYIKVNKLTYQIPGAGFGASTVINIPPAEFTRNYCIRVVIGNLAANQNLCAQWLPNMIQDVRIQIGASDTISLGDGQTMLKYLLSQCNSKAKKDKIIAMSGQYTAGATSSNSEASFILKLPFSSVKKNGIPLPNYMLGAPVSITIQWAPYQNIVTGSAAISLPFVSAEMSCDSIMSIDTGSLIHLKDSTFYDLPFKRLAAQNLINFTGSTSVGQPVQLNLLGFMSGKLVGVLFSVAKASDETDKNYQIYQIIQNIKLQLNGQVLSNFAGRTYEVLSLCNSDADGDQANFSSSNGVVTSNWYFLKLTLDTPESNATEYNYSNTMSVANNQLQLSFTTPDSSNYNMRVAYVYENHLRIFHDKSVAFLAS